MVILGIPAVSLFVLGDAKTKRPILTATGSLLIVVVAVGLGILIVVGKLRDALNPSTTAVPSLTLSKRFVFSESYSNFIV